MYETEKKPTNKTTFINSTLAFSQSGSINVNKSRRLDFCFHTCTLSPPPAPPSPLSLPLPPFSSLLPFVLVAAAVSSLLLWWRWLSVASFPTTPPRGHFSSPFSPESFFGYIVVAAAAVVVVESMMIFPASMADWIATLINFVLVDNKRRSSCLSSSSSLLLLLDW